MLLAKVSATSTKCNYLLQKKHLIHYYEIKWQQGPLQSGPQGDAHHQNRETVSNNEQQVN